MATAAIKWPDRPLRSLLPRSAPKRLMEQKPVEKKALVIQYSAQQFWGMTGGPDDSREQALSGFTAYAISALAYSCIRYRSTKLVEAPIWIVEETEDGEEWLTKDHPLSMVLEQPNADMEMSDLLECVSVYLDVTGRALLVKNRDRGGRVAALYPFSGDDFAVKMTDDRLAGEFQVRTSKGTRYFEPDDVIFFKNLDPRFANEGLAPLDAALAHVNIGYEMRRAVAAALRNQIKPGAIFEYPNILQPEDSERQKAEIASAYAGVQATGRSMMLEGGAKATIMEASLKNLALGPVQDDVEAAVCSCFQVHPSVVGAKLGLTANSGLADTIEPATKLFYDLFAFPSWSRIEKTLTRSLLREVDDNPLRFIRFDKTKVRSLAEDLKARTEEATAAAGYWTRNERRLHTGQQALPDGDLRGEEIDGSSTETATEVNEPDAPRLRLVKKQPLRMETKQDARSRLWRKFDVKARRDESKYEDAARKQFEAEREAVNRLFENTTDATLQSALRKLNEAYTTEEGEYVLQWIERYTKLVTDTFDAAGSDLAAELGFDFNLSNPRVQSSITKRVNKLSGNVTETTYQQIRDIVGEGKQPVREIAKRIRDEVFGGEITKARSTTIARTESVGVLNHAELVAARESGIIVDKEWLSQGDKRVRDSHETIDGSRVPLESKFDNGLRHPGDQGGSAEEVCNCRCTLLFHTDTDGKADDAVKPEVKVASMPQPAINIVIPERVVVRSVKKRISNIRNSRGEIVAHEIEEVAEDDPSVTD